MRTPFLRSTGLVAVATAAVLLTGCAGAGANAVGDTASVTVPGGAGDYTFDVTVTSLDEAPESVTSQYEGSPQIWFAEVSAVYTGDKPADEGFPLLYNGVYATLADGSYLETMFTGMTECTGVLTAETDWAATFVAGDTVEFCVPISGDGATEVTGVYVGPTDVNEAGGAEWTL